MIDEVGKKRLLVPHNLQSRGGSGMFCTVFFLTLKYLINPFLSGFPPPDIQVRNWLTQAPDQYTAFLHAAAYVTALLQNITNFTQSQETSNHAEIIQSFYDLMSRGQTAMGQGEDRIAFFDSVVKRAEEVSFTSQFTTFPIFQ